MVSPTRDCDPPSQSFPFIYNAQECVVDSVAKAFPIECVFPTWFVPLLILAMDITAQRSGYVSLSMGILFFR